MKFGDTLVQRSVPQWRNYNVDYSTLRCHFKNPTSYPLSLALDGTALLGAVNNGAQSRPVIIPTNEPSKTSRNKQPVNIEDKLYNVLKAEHDRVGLFVRSKCYEIESRLGSIERSLKQLERRRFLAENAIKPKNTLRLQQRFSKVESDILRLGNEIQNISRFIAINKLAIRKLLNKYVKSTGSSSIAEKVEKELFNNSDSFVKIDLGHALSRYTDFLHAVRVPFNGDRSLSTSFHSGAASLSHSSGLQTRKRQIPAYLAERALRSDTDFDLILSEPESEHQAVYWVHYDNIVELRIMLLQHMRSAESTKETTPDLNRKSSESDDQNDQSSNCGAIIMSQRNNIEKSQQSRKPFASTSEGAQQPADTIRWAINDGKVLSLQLSGNENEGSELPSKIKLKGGDPSALLRIIRFPRSGGNASASDDDRMSQSEDELRTSSSLSKYLGRTADKKPIACTFYKRSRFLGLENSNFQFLIAALDENLEFGSALGGAGANNFGHTQRFPHATLTVNCRGTDSSLIRTLDRSHLTEAISGFSFESHAYSLSKNDSETEEPPHWLPKLNTDIRHVPAEIPSIPSPRSGTLTSNFNISNERLTSSSSDNLRTPNLTSRSGTSGSGPVTPNTVTFVNNMAEKHPSWTNAVAGSSTLHEDGIAQIPRATLASQPPARQQLPIKNKYWNEYDHPSSDTGAREDEAFFVYIDPHAPLFPGQHLLSRMTRKVVDLFSFHKDGAHVDVERWIQPPNSSRKRVERLRTRASYISSSSSDENDSPDINEEADDELSQATALIQDSTAPKYGTFDPTQPQSQLLHASRTVSPEFSVPKRASLTLPTLCILASIVTLTVMSALVHATRTSLQARSEAKVAILVGVAAALAFILLSLRLVGKVNREAEGDGDFSISPDVASNGIFGTMAAILICVWAGVLVALVIVF